MTDHHAVRPSREEFRALARAHTVVPVWREVLADFETPLSAFVKLVGDREGFLLESVEHAERWGRFSFLGRDSARTFVTRGREVRWLDGAPPPEGVPTDQGTLAALEALLARYRAPVLPELPPFHGGIVGWIGYDTVREIERLPNVPADDTGFPDAVCALAGQVVAFDHFRQRMFVIENVYPPAGSDDAALDELYDGAVKRLRAAVEELGRPLPYMPAVPPSADVELPAVRRNFTPAQWEAAVEAAKEHILEGDIFQVVLAQRFDLVDKVDPLAMYRVLRLVNPSPYMYVLQHPEASVVGSSPEALVQVRAGRVIARPIAGTRRRGRNEEHDRRMEAELVEHPKERAEHVMLVDLARNDLGRVVRFGTECVEELMTLERYSHVMHMTSQVAGELADDKGPIDVLRATFPAGTVSGAPKVRAMEIIDELEPTKRGPYAGVVGYVDFSGNLDTAIAIRTMFWRDGRAVMQAGAGVVADSVPADEDLECRNKAQALLTAAAAAQHLMEDI